MDKSRFLPYAQQHVFPEDIEEVSRALSNPVITRGPLVEEFEQSLANYCGAKYGVAFTNCSSGIMAAYHAADLGASDRLISSPNTFVASVGPGMLQQATPLFIDIDRHTGNLDLDQLSFNVNQPQSRGKTIIAPVHFAGIPVDVQAIEKMVQHPNTIIIEDAAHALGSHYKDGSKVGCCKWSDMTIFSFHPAKNITTGEGGMVMTNSEDFYQRLRLFRNNGIKKDQADALPWYYEVTELTGNYNFTEIQAALGLSQLKHLDLFVAKRQELIQHYRNKLSSVDYVFLLDSGKNEQIAYHICVVQIDFEAYKTTRAEVMKALNVQGIGSQVHYIPLYRHPFFVRYAGDISEYFPETEAYYAQALTLPLFYSMTEEDVDRVVTTLKRVLNRN